MVEKFKWVRQCGGECCELCAPYDGSVYDSEAEAKRKLHGGCQCTAYKVPKCGKGEGKEMRFDDVKVSKLDGDYSMITGKLTYKATVTNESDSEATDVEASVTIKARGKEVINETERRPTLGSHETWDIRGRGKMDRDDAISASDNTSVVIKMRYKKNGEEHSKTNACYL